MELQQIAKQNIDYLINNYQVSCFVLACNTITACAIDCLRSTYLDYSFVGTEPPIKQALEYTANNCLVASTRATALSQRLKERFNQDNVKFVAFDKLASMVECQEPSKNISRYINSVLEKQDYNFDCVALGCTHFLLCKYEFSQAFIGEVFDGSLGVASRVKQLVGKARQEFACSVILTKHDDNKYNQIVKLLQ